jgi:hypothetical protein
MAQGTIRRFNGQKGYGFIQPHDGPKDVFRREAMTAAILHRDDTAIPRAIHAMRVPS